MTKALIKKQLLEVFSWLYFDKTKNKSRTKSKIIAYAILYVILFGVVGAIFYMFGSILAPLADAGMGWLYWCLMGLIAIFLGVFGSVFNTYASLYDAKDNDLLLAMPISPGRILLTRLFGVYFIGFIYELMVMVPAMIAWFSRTRSNLLGTIFIIINPFVLSAIILVLSAALGWVVALIASKLKRKNILTAIIFVVVIAVYYYFSSQIGPAVQSFLENASDIGRHMIAPLYPLYQMGLAAEGNVLAMLIFVGISAALLLIVYLVMSRSFLRLATTNRGTVKVVYKEKAAVMKSVDKALQSKELRKFLGSSTYMLNCGLGIALFPIATVAFIWNLDTFYQLMAVPVIHNLLPLIASGAVCLIASMNLIAAPSVSLEGKNIWILQSLPVKGWQILKAKLMLHLKLTIVPSAILLIAIEIILKPVILSGILIPLSSVLFMILMGALSLFSNLKAPNLTWTSETVPIKQGSSVVIMLFGSWGIIAGSGFLYYLLNSIISAEIFLLVLSVVFLLFSLILIKWLQTKGAEIFENL